MSGLGELLLGKVERSQSPKDVKGRNNNNDDSESNKSCPTDRLDQPTKNQQDDRSNPSNIRQQIKVPDRIERNNKDVDERSNTSSTDDYVRELLDPNDRPRNVWHVVEGPKGSPDDHNYEGREQSRVKTESGFDNDNDSLLDNFKQEANSDIPPEQRNASSLDCPRRLKGDPEPCAEDTRSIVQSREHDHNEEISRNHSRDRSSASRHRDSNRHSSRDNDESRSNREYERHGSSSRHRSGRKRDYHDDKDEGDSRSSSKRYKSSRRRSVSRSRSRSISRSPAYSSSRRRRERSRSNSPRQNARTVIIMQLSQRVNSRDLEDFFTDEVGSVREVRLIMDSRTRRHKGVAYIEFNNSRSASKALSLSGKKLHGVPLTIQAVDHSRGSDHKSSFNSHHQTSRHHTSSSSPSRNNSSSNYRSSTTTSHPSSRSLPPNAYRVYIGALHTGITDEMLRTIVEPFGPVLRLELIKDRTTGASRGYAFVTYANAEDGQEAVRCLDGFELAGKNMRVSKSTEKGEH